jgi:hypothetical protein
VTRTERCPGRGRHRGSDIADQPRSETNDSAPVRQKAPIARAMGLAPAAGRVLWAWIVAAHGEPAAALDGKTSRGYLVAPPSNYATGGTCTARRWSS